MKVKILREGTKGKYIAAGQCCMLIKSDYFAAPSPKTVGQNP